MGPLLSALAQAAPDDRWLPLYELGWALEFPVFLASAALTVVGLWLVVRPGLHRLFVAVPNPGVGIARAAVVFSGLWFWFVMENGAASDVEGFYVALYALFAYAALLLGGFVFPVQGLYFRGDVHERGNLAAALVLTGFALGTAFAFGGALTGEGPGWWVVLVFFVLAYWELRATMGATSRVAGRLFDDARLERDASAGLLLGAVALASGLVSGRAAAGDFLGWEHALRDYGLRLWPLLVVALAGAAAGAFTRDHPRKLAWRAAASAVLVAGGLAIYFLT